MVCVRVCVCACVGVCVCVLVSHCRAGNSERLKCASIFYKALLRKEPYFARRFCGRRPVLHMCRAFCVLQHVVYCVLQCVLQCVLRFFY